MTNKPCGKKTEQFMRDYSPDIQSIQCAFANEEAMKAFTYALNTDLLSFSSGSDKSNNAFYVEIRPRNDLLLTLPLLHDLIKYTTAHKRKKMRPSAIHNYCEINLRAYKKLSNGTMYHTFTRNTLHCPEFEQNLPTIMRKLRKDVGVHERHDPY